PADEAERLEDRKIAPPAADRRQQRVGERPERQRREQSSEDHRQAGYPLQAQQLRPGLPLVDREEIRKERLVLREFSVQVYSWPEAHERRDRVALILLRIESRETFQRHRHAFAGLSRLEEERRDHHFAYDLHARGGRRGRHRA